MFNPLNLLRRKPQPVVAESAQPVAVQPRPMLVGIAFDKHGRPKLEEDFVKNMSPVVRVHVNNKLLARGYKLTDTAPFYTEA